VSEVLVLGVSHKTAPVALRERLAIPDPQVASFLRDLQATSEIREAAIISTCNRTELYLVSGDPVEAETDALSMLARRAGIRPTELAAAIYAERNCDAARQLFRVSAGLESMIVGESEVQGQVRRAFDRAVAAGTTGPMLNQLFRAALETGKRVRTETAIGERHLSVASVAVGLARETLGGLIGREAVILGAGETGELTARALVDQGADTLFVANRSRGRAVALANRFGGEAAGFDELPEALGRADIVVAATSSPHALLEADDVEAVMDARQGRPLLLLDLAVPRDIDPGCKDLDGVALYDIDDLQAAVARNRSVRQAEATRAQGIVEEEIGKFAAWLGGLEVRPTLAALRARGDEIARLVLLENEGRWETLSERDRQRVEAMANAIVKRLLHEPTVRLKDLAGENAHARMQVVRELFGLEEPEEEGLAEVRPLRRPAS
jgi:glutamyl-tRNA reductase